MKTSGVINRESSVGNQKGFTLIELLVVIAIISALAAMIFPITGAVNKAKIRSRAKAELAQIETAIESYKAKHGVYPPADIGNPALNPLYYELVGSKLDAGGNYATKDGITISAADVPKTFGTAIGGFLNCTKGGGDDDATT